MVGRYGHVRDEGRELVEVEMVLKCETHKAFQVARDEDAEPVWLPRSLVQVRGKGPVVKVTMPEWLAEKGRADLMGHDVKQDDAAVQSLFTEAAGILGDLRSKHDEIDCGLLLCFALALHKLDSLTDEAYLGLIRTTLSKALVDVKKNDRQAQAVEASQAVAQPAADEVGEGR